MKTQIDSRGRALLTLLPSWALEEELARRRFEVSDPTVAVGDLVVDPVASVVTWGHDSHAVMGRRMEILYALAKARKRGHRRVPGRWLASVVFRGMETYDADCNLRQYLNYLKREIPGLVLMSTDRRLGYGLNVAEDAGRAVAS